MLLNYYLEVARVAQELKEEKGLSYKDAIAAAKEILKREIKNGRK